MSEIRVYVACLGCYNDGRLKGKWWDATTVGDEEEACEDAQAAHDYLTGCSYNHPFYGVHEEWAIHDHEGFEGIGPGEYDRLADVQDTALMLAAYSGAWAAWVRHVDKDRATEDAFLEAFLGEWTSLAAYAEESYRDCGMMPTGPEYEWLDSHIDWKSVASELEMDCSVWTADAPDGCIYVFANL